MKTSIPKQKDIKQKWHLIDAKDKVLGRLATKIAMILMGKDKPDYVPHLHTGDGVVVINAKDIKVTGKKPEQKLYKRFSGYPGGLKEFKYSRVHEQHPDEIIRHAVKGMLPKNKLRAKMMKNLKVYGGNEHKQQAQQPVELKV